MSVNLFSHFQIPIFVFKNVLLFRGFLEVCEHFFIVDRHRECYSAVSLETCGCLAEKGHLGSPLLPLQRKLHRGLMALVSLPLLQVFLSLDLSVFLNFVCNEISYETFFYHVFVRMLCSIISSFFLYCMWIESCNLGFSMYLVIFRFSDDIDWIIVHLS